MSFLPLSDSGISDKIINSLPGIFYLYEKIGDQVFLKKWNANHVKLFGYSDEELVNMPVSTFFTDQEYKRVENVIVKVFTDGKSQIRTMILTKSGEQVPHLLEAHSFVEDDRHFMMGVGIDITSQLKVESTLENAINEQNKLSLEKSKVNEQLESKKRELITIAVETGERNQTINTTILDLQRIIEDHPQNELIQQLTRIYAKLEQKIRNKDEWGFFKLSFIEVHHNFINNLHKKHPQLTKSELRFCTYLKIHLSSHQIAAIQNVTLGAIKQSRYRIRKKLGLETKDALEDYVLRF